MGTKIMPVSDLRRKTRSVIDAVRSGGEAVYITQYGRPAVVLVDYERYEQLLAQLQDLSDRLSLETAAHEPTRPYADLAAEMGLEMVSSADESASNVHTADQILR